MSNAPHSQTGEWCTPGIGEIHGESEIGYHGKIRLKGEDAGRTIPVPTRTQMSQLAARNQTKGATNGLRPGISCFDTDFTIYIGPCGALSEGAWSGE